ncbi:MAG: hypothetical protein H6835_14900 [Planctomycetes bacterium]|nr:hypothetical protein [Planctomycetota bacterium]
MRRTTFALLLAAAAACSGGGGSTGSSDAMPVIVTASFSGGSSTPTAGDTLILSFSETVSLVTATLFDDDDCVLSGGATLGSVATAPSVVSANTISITLGSGVTFTPGTTTIALAIGNDAVKDASGQFGNGGTAVTIGTSDGAAPTISNVTIADVDDELNGTGAAGGTLQVPRTGWTIDLAYSDNTGIDTSRTVITASVAVSTGSGTQLAGTNLRPFLTAVSASNSAASYSVPSTVLFPNGAVTLTCTVVDVSGLASTGSTFAAVVRAFTSALQPFETTVNSSQVWFLDFSRDIEQFSATAITGGMDVTRTSTSNGRADFVDLLFVLGLQTASPIANVSAGLDSNQVVLARLEAEIVTQLGTIYDGAPVTFTLTRPSGTFVNGESVPYSSLGYSQISVAGSASSPGVLGLAIFDPSNATQNDDTQVDFQGARLGVFLFTLVDAFAGPPSSSLFRTTFDPFTSTVGGTPIGADAADDDRLNGTNTDSRRDEIDAAIDDLARFLAVVIAHECGHSVGLVQNDPMPAGLYGDDSINFPGSSDGHIRNASLFPVGATNVMSPSLSYSTAINAASGFNSLNLAYLREQVFYGN